jgi:catechol 2,3-dioxygenase-like lactoylglutathione lyase family enzyme
MIDHLSTYATDFPATRAFYETALKPLGYSLQMELTASEDPEFPERRICAFGPPGKPTFWIIEVRSPVSPRHVAFVAPDRRAVGAFHAAALRAGGRDNGAAGLRPEYHLDYFGAFAFDPDGNNVEAVCHAHEG